MTNGKGPHAGDIDEGAPDILTLRVDQIDHMTIMEVNLIQRLAREDVPAESIPDRTLDWLHDLGLVTVVDGQVELKPDGVVFEPLVTPDEAILSEVYQPIPDSERYGGYDKEEELEGTELPPAREPRTLDDED